MRRVLTSFEPCWLGGATGRTRCPRRSAAPFHFLERGLVTPTISGQAECNPPAGWAAAFWTRGRRCSSATRTVSGGDTTATACARNPGPAASWRRPRSPQIIRCWGPFRGKCRVALGIQTFSSYDLPIGSPLRKSATLAASLCEITLATRRSSTNCFTTAQMADFLRTAKC